jgi:hypothetical protein
MSSDDNLKPYHAQWPSVIYIVAALVRDCDETALHIYASLAETKRHSLCTPSTNR